MSGNSKNLNSNFEGPEKKPENTGVANKQLEITKKKLLEDQTLGGAKELGNVEVKPLSEDTKKLLDTKTVIPPYSKDTEEMLNQKPDFTNTSDDVSTSVEDFAEQLSNAEADEIFNGNENVVDDANISNDVSADETFTTDVNSSNDLEDVSISETAIRAGLILNSSFEYYQANANEITQNPDLHEDWQSAIKSLAGDSYDELKTAGNGDLQIFKSVVDSFNNAEHDEQKKMFVYNHPEISEQLPSLLNSEPTQKATVAGIATGAAAQETETDSNDGSDDSGDGGNGGATTGSTSNGNGKKQGWIKRHLKGLIVGTTMAALVAGGWFGFPAERDAAWNYAADQLGAGNKTEQVQKKSSDEVKEDGGITPSGTFTVTPPSSTISTTPPSSTTTTKAASVQDVAKTLEQAKSAQKEAQAESKKAVENARFTIESDGTYLFDMTNPQNAKLANRYGISGFVKFAMQDAGCFEGINSEFMKLVDKNCDQNLGVSLKDCDTWNVRDLNVKNTMVISIGQEVSQVKPAEKPVEQTVVHLGQEKTDSTNVRPTEATVNINCEYLLDVLGVDSTERQNLKYVDGAYVIEYKMIDSLKPLDDCVFMADLSECRLVIGPDSSFMFEGPAIIPFDADSSNFVQPSSTITDTTSHVKSTSELNSENENKAKGAAPVIIKPTDTEKDKSESILRRSFLHKR